MCDSETRSSGLGSPGSVPGRREAPRWKAEKFPTAEPGQGDLWGGGGARSGRWKPRPAGREPGKASRGRCRAEPHRGPARGSPHGARAERGHPGRYLLLDLPVLRDDPMRGGQGSSGHHAQQSGKAEKPTWAGARRQLEPAADPYCRRHLAPPAGPLTPEAEVAPRHPPSWGGRLWSRRRSPRTAAGLTTTPFSIAWGQPVLGHARAVNSFLVSVFL